MTHPYKNRPSTSFWSRAVSNNWDPGSVIASDSFLIRLGEKIMSAGSCFASNMVPYLTNAGFKYLKTEAPHLAFVEVPDEAYGYGKFSAAYGNIYTARQLLQLLLRSLGEYKPVEDRWYVEDRVVDPFRPGLKYAASTDVEFDLLTRQHLRCVLEAFSSADVFVFTLGLTEAWISAIDGAVFPVCPGTISGTFDPHRHVFQNFSVADIVADLSRFIRRLKQINPRVRIILTVSPVPLVATATGNHVLLATMYSKSVLRAAAQEVTDTFEGVRYFPAYELATGPQAPKTYFESDRRNVSQEAIASIMNVLLSGCEGVKASSNGTISAPTKTTASAASQAIMNAECEEAMLDR